MTMLLHKIKFKIAVLITVLLLLTASIFSFLTVQTMSRHIADEVIKKAESLGKSAAALSAYSILSGDMLGIDNTVSKIKETNADIEYIAVTDKSMKILAHDLVERRGEIFEPGEGRLLKRGDDGTSVVEINANGYDCFELTIPVTFNSKLIGTVVIGINKSVLVNAQDEIRSKIIAGLAVTLSLGLLCIIFLSSFITRPIKELSAGVHGFKQGMKSGPLRVYSGDELGILTKSFNEMTELITAQQARLGTYAQELEDSYISTVKVLAAAIDARDPYTLGHSARVAKLSIKMGKAIGLSKKEIEDLEIACLFHDVGKLKTPDDVLLKNGALDSADYLKMIRHPEEGAEILSRAPSLHKYIPAVKHHHEWFNGSGYPDGLSGREIPLFASIISIADAFDAMTSTRPYKLPLSEENAMRELVLFSGTQFNPDLVQIFLKVIGEHYTPVEHLPETDQYHGYS
jgi:putative nucleotidyltransferase with HDIG domain